MLRVNQKVNEMRNAFSNYVSQILKCDDIKQSVRNLFDFMKQQIPLDFLTIVAYDEERHAVYDRIHATGENVVFVDDLIPFTQKTRAYAGEIFKGQSNTIYIADGRKDPLVREFDEDVGINETASMITQIAQLEKGRYAACNLVSWGEAAHSIEHQEYVRKLSDPFSFVLRHIYSNISRTGKKLTKQEKRTKTETEIIGKDGGLREVLVLTDIVAKLNTPVLLFGESGVGKEVLAERIHSRSKRKNREFICVNCGAVPETLIDSELFGHEKNAFTGAGDSRKGYFEQADGGTILLDEISELSKNAQVKLLRVLQNQSFHRVGGERPISVNIRVLAASNRNLEEMVRANTFRKDLWFRLNRFPINVPPLRKRKQDIVPLVNYFAKIISSELNLPYQYRFAEKATDQLHQYDWPGNIRELRNTVEYAMILSRGKPISFEFLQGRKEISLFPKPAARPDRFLTMDEMMRSHIRDVLSYTNGRIEGRNGAAKILAINPSTLRARMKKLGIRIMKSS